MSVNGIADWYQEDQGWDDSTLLAICLEYIGNQQSDDAFEDFLRDHAEAKSEKDEPEEYVMYDRYQDLTQPGIYDREPDEPGMDYGPDEED